MEQADRAVQDHRQRLLRRNQRPCVLSDHVAAGPYPGRYGDAGSNLADQRQYREARLQGHRHQISPEHPRAYRSHRRPRRNETGQRRVSSSRAKPTSRLLEGGYYPGAREETALTFPPVKVDRTVREGDTVTVGDVTLTAHETPGHSPGCTSWTFNGERRRCDALGAHLLQRHRGAEPPRHQPDLSRDRDRLPEDVRAGKGHEAGRAARAASGNVQDGRRSAPSSPMARPIRSSIPASSTPMRRRWKRRSRTRWPSRPPPRRKRRGELARAGAAQDYPPSAPCVFT